MLNNIVCMYNKEGKMLGIDKKKKKNKMAEGRFHNWEENSDFCYIFLIK